MTEIAKVHEEVLQYLLEYKKLHPDFMFTTRKTNRSERLQDGYWFIGNDDYLSIGLVNRGCEHNKTQQIHFSYQFADKSCFLEVAYGAEQDEQLLNFYHDLSNLFDYEKRYADNTKLYKSIGIGFENAFHIYMTEYHPKIMELINKHDLITELVVSADDFNHMQERINQYKGTMTGISTTRPTSYFAINTILYGPPGTGKTFTVTEKALRITGLWRDEYSDFANRKEATDKFETLQKEGQIAFVTFHQSYSYEDFVEGIKPEVNANDNVTYKVSAGVFKKICDEARLNYEMADSTIKKAPFNKVFGELIRPLEEKSVASIKIEMKQSFFMITEVNSRTIFFDKAEGESKHSLSISTLNRFYDNGSVDIKGGLGVYYDPLLEKLNDIAKSENYKTTAMKNFVLVIDEINRGNISKIFGELITLVEDTKRIGAPDELRITLPYSPCLFGVPQNLYIIGTMNTADRSIALLDTALRRRFEFVEMMPEYSLLEDIDGIEISKMLKKINERITYLYDRDHQIGHAYFLPLKSEPTLDKLKDIFYKKIIPLLQEYFYDDWSKIQVVLGGANKQKFIIEEETQDEALLEILNGDTVRYSLSALENEAELITAFKNIYE